MDDTRRGERADPGRHGIEWTCSSLPGVVSTDPGTELVMTVPDAPPLPRTPHDTVVSSWVVVVFCGELDIGSRSALNVLHEAVRAHPGAHVLVDLSDVTFMDSTALVAFAKAKSRAAAGGGVLSLHGASAFAQRMLDIWHLEPVCSKTRQSGDVHEIRTLRGHTVVPFLRPRGARAQHSDERPSCVGNSLDREIGATRPAGPLEGTFTAIRRV